MPSHCYIYIELLHVSCYILYHRWRRIKSKEGTAQDDPTSMGAYFLGILPKSCLLAKEDQLPNVSTLFDNSNVNIMVEGKRHLGAIAGSEICKREYVDNLVKNWNSQLCIFSTRAEGFLVQRMEYSVDELAIKKIELEIKKEKENAYKYNMEHLKENMFKKSKRLLKLSTGKGLSNWLTMLPIVEYGFELSKQQFWDSICLRYSWEISKLPTTYSMWK